MWTLAAAEMVLATWSPPRLAFAQSDTADTHASRLENTLDVACPTPLRADIITLAACFPATVPVKAQPEGEHEYLPSANVGPLTVKVKVPAEEVPV